MERPSHIRRTPPRPIYIPPLAQYLAMSFPGLGARKASGGYPSASASSSAYADSPVPSPSTVTSPRSFASHLPIPPDASSVSLARNLSSSSRSSFNTSAGGERRGRGLIPSPRVAPTGLPQSQPQPHSGTTSAASSASGSRSGSFIAAHTPKILSRRSSQKEGRSGGLLRSGSGRDKSKGRDKERDRERDEPPPLPTPGVTPGESIEVIETQQVRSNRHPGTGRRMINQYVILHEIGHGTHGTVRLGKDTTHEPPPPEDGEEPEEPLEEDESTYWAIKMVDRMPKRKKLQTLRKGALGRTDGGKLVGENEIRKEIAIFKKVHHPNIVRMREIIDDPEQSKIFMIMEYCKGGEISWKADDGSPALTLGETRRIFRDTLLGLEYCIIHRDIKPSNLLRSSDGTVKISDFGCSHYSEALQVASNNPGPDGDHYVDDVELAKTAGSPAFFAPEMCYSGLDDEPITRDSFSSHGTPQQELPAFTLRPPSVAGLDTPERHRTDTLPMSPGGRILPLKPTMSNDSARRPMSVRSHSSATTFRRDIPRLPITNAIDVWALGVTLYCLLFGRTPFDAPNEYLLMQVIPVAEFEIPPTLGKDRIATFGPDVSPLALEAIDLLRRLLAKSAQQRITLEQAKKHPFTLRGMSDPTTWLARTDPHAQTFVTVSNEEVMAAIGPSGNFKSKWLAPVKRLLRYRSRSVTGHAHGLGTPAPTPTPTPTPMPEQHMGTFKVKSRVPREASMPPIRTDMGTIPGVRSAEPTPALPSGAIQLGSPPFNGQMERNASASSTSRSGFMSSRNKPRAPSNLVLPIKPQLVPLADERSPTKMTSSSSLDKYKKTVVSASVSPPGSMRRRMSDVDVDRRRQRAPSNASSSQHSGVMGKLSNFIRTSSRRSKFGRSREGASVSDNMSDKSPIEALRRMSVDERSQAASNEHDHEDDGETFASSYSSHRLHSPGPSTESHLGLTGQWTSRLPNSGLAPVRRNSSPIPPPQHMHMGAGSEVEGLEGGEEEEVDWIGSTSDDDDDVEYEDTPGVDAHLEQGPPKAAPKTWRDVLGETDGAALPTPVATAPGLETVPDASPPEVKSRLGLSPETYFGVSGVVASPEPVRVAAAPAPATAPALAAAPPSPTSPSNSMRARLSSSPNSPTNEFGQGYGGFGSGRSRGGSPYRSHFGHERARSPLRPVHDEDVREEFADAEAVYPSRPYTSRLVNQPSHNGSLGTSSSASSPRGASFLARPESSDSASAGGSVQNHPATPTHANMYLSGLISPLDLDPPHSPLGASALLRHGSGSGAGLGKQPPHAHAHAHPHAHVARGHVEENEEGALAISFGGTKKGRGRKGSVLSRMGDEERTASPSPAGRE